MEKYTWCSEYITQKTLADTIEAFMAARGEYDFYFEDKIRWIKTDDRKGNARFILSEIQTKRNGGRVSGKPHIAPAEAHGEEMLTNLIEEALS